MKEFIKDVLANIVYVLYRFGIIRNPLQVASIDETLEELIHTGKSIVRFGDSDIVMMCGRTTIVQENAPELSGKLKKILHYDEEGLMVGIPDIFGDLSQYSARSRKFWKKHLLSFRSVYEKQCNTEKIYYNAFLSRMYYNYQNKENCGRWLEKFKQVWKDRKIVFVEGAGTHNGVGNDLFDGAESIERIICPPYNAFYVYGDIVEACRKMPKDRLFLISLGSTAKVLTAELYEEGYRVIDIGNLDMEYEWYLRKASDKPKIEKHSVTGRQANEEAGYGDYLNQIIAWIELKE